MMKKILAAAIVSAFAAPAFAATSNVDIYGVASFSVDFVDGGTDDTTVADIPGFTNSKSGERRTRVSSNNSLIGFKGSEDLGGGLSAVWQIESSIAMDAGALNSAGTRNTFAGLSSKTLGTLTFGVIDSPLKTSTGKLDVFGNTLAGYIGAFTEHMGDYPWMVRLAGDLDVRPEHAGLLGVFGGLAVTLLVFSVALWAISGRVVTWMHGAEKTTK